MLVGGGSLWARDAEVVTDATGRGVFNLGVPRQCRNPVRCELPYQRVLGPLTVDFAAVRPEVA